MTSGTAWEFDDAVVLETGRELPAHTSRLMDALGVEVRKPRLQTGRSRGRRAPVPAHLARLEDGAEVVFVAGVPRLWHLPQPGEADERKTLCGLTGPVYAYGAIARERRCCSVCVRASTKHGMARRSQPKSGGTFGNGSKAPGYRRWLANQRAGSETRNPICAATNAHGKPCRRRALDGRDVCSTHAPEYQARNAEHMAEMRARSPIQDMDRLEPAEPLAKLLRSYRADGGSWRNLADRTQIPDHYLVHVSRGEFKHVDRTRAQRIRNVLLPITDAASPLETAA